MNRLKIPGIQICRYGWHYQGEFGAVIEVDYYSMNQQSLKRTTIHEGQIIRDNETLALLRAYGIKYFLTGNQFIKENEVDIQTAIHPEHGYEFRKVELLIKKYKG
ncbi:MAG: hypothetical protein H6556_23370 [Lewinellaceae bacterium]|nr:hypothetical protein [Lewinellaceae bacterium]